MVLPSDAADLAAALALGDEIKKYVDHLDGAFLNAGIAAFAPIEATTPKIYDDLFNVNVRGLYFQLQSLLPVLCSVYIVHCRFYRIPDYIDLFGNKGCRHLPW